MEKSDFLSWQLDKEKLLGLLDSYSRGGFGGPVEEVRKCLARVRESCGEHVVTAVRDLVLELAVMRTKVSSLRVVSSLSMSPVEISLTVEVNGRDREFVYTFKDFPHNEAGSRKLAKKEEDILPTKGIMVGNKRLRKKLRNQQRRQPSK